MTYSAEAIIKADDAAILLYSDLREALKGAPTAESIVLEGLLEQAVSISHTLTRLRNQ